MSGMVNRIVYKFHLGDGRHYQYTLRIDEKTVVDPTGLPETLPEWTKLGFHQCPNCTLREEEHPQCPVAARLASLVEDWNEVMSYDSVHVEVDNGKRIVSASCSAQQALSSLLGLIMATSDCPHTQFFKPMAHFHLPFANHEETLFRAVSTYFLAKYFVYQEDGKVDLEFRDFVKVYENMQEVNRSMAKRIQAHETRDAATNAMVLLHILTCTLPTTLDESLDQLRELFTPIVKQFQDNGHVEKEEA